MEIKDTWSVAGLCGTGSHDFVVNDVFVPAERTFSLFEDESCLASPLGRVPELSFSALEIANVAVAIAQGALEEIGALAVEKRRCSPRGRWQRTRCSNIASVRRTPSSVPPARSCTPTPRTRGRPR